MTAIAGGFNSAKPISCAQGRYGELIIAQGAGLQPQRWTGSGLCTNAGIVAPATAPTITLNTTPRYYVARADVVKPGAVYNRAPAVTFSTPSSPPTGFRLAKASAHLNQSVVQELRMIDGGKHYPSPPTITLSATYGSGAVLTPVMDGTMPNADTISHYEIVQGPPFDDEEELRSDFRTQWSTWGAVEIPLTNGSGTITRTIYIYHGACEGGSNLADWYGPVNLSLPYTVTGATGTGAVAIVNFHGQRVVWSYCERNSTGGYNSFVRWALSCFCRSVRPKSGGSGYSTDGTVTITITPAVTWNTATGTQTATIPDNKKLIIEGYPPGHPKNTSTPRRSIRSITVTNGGSGYTVAPDIKIESSTGFGAYASATVTNGAITGVSLRSGGGGYQLPPTVTAVSGGAEASAVARPHLRGKYQCYYRYVDNTAAALGGPIPSNLSPVREMDAGDGAQSMTWTVAAASNTDERNLTVELWRTTGDQALMLYRVAAAASFTSFVDDLTDEDVRNPDRAGYLAMPIVLPNGDLNAMRFTPPPNNKAVVVRYQDRFWYAVDTSGPEPNSIYFSEVDEPESVPDINELVLQQNSRDSDAITALIPSGSSLLVMQSRHAYSLSYSKQPLLDADVSHVANRGCVNQRCWDIHDGLCYILDRHGVYSWSPQSGVQDVSAPIADMFRSRIDWSNTTWNFLLVDAAKKVLRAFVAFTEDGTTTYPTRALCYSIETKSWWVERYPHRISAGAAIPVGAAHQCVYGGQGGIYMLDTGSVDAARGAVTKVTVTQKGAGYLKPPVVTAPGGVGAEFSAVIDTDGRISGIWILNPGYGYSSGSLSISAPDDPDCAAPVQATATFTATSTSTDTSISPVYRYKTGNRAFPTDSTVKDGGSRQARDIAVTYRPQASKCDLAVRLYYNNSANARPNAVSRNRGVGFSSSADDGAARVDMAAMTTRTGYDSGVAKALFSGRSIDDVQSSDRHVSVELLGARAASDPVVIYNLDVYGTGTPSGG